jgi:hypothetical protein
VEKRDSCSENMAIWTGNGLAGTGKARLPLFRDCVRP